MKKLLPCLAAVCLTFACATEEKASFEEGISATPGASECCSEKAAAECSSEEVAECSSEKAAECTAEQKVCPVTGEIQ